MFLYSDYCFFEVFVTFALKAVNPLKRHIPFLTEALIFPPAEQANRDGLLAAGGDLSTERLILAYQQGIFPWFNKDSLILWWCPDPRMVLFPEELKVSRSMKKVLHSGRFTLSRNCHFENVLRHCAAMPRKGQTGTWITEEMQRAYLKLHELGLAKSYEVWEGKNLVGGLYGLDLGHIFCGESMFFRVSNASKFAFIHLASDLKTQGYRLIDCQVYNPHLASLGAREIPRKEFLGYLKGNHQGVQKEQHL